MSSSCEAVRATPSMYIFLPGQRRVRHRYKVLLVSKIERRLRPLASMPYLCSLIRSKVRQFKRHVQVQAPPYTTKPMNSPGPIHPKFHLPRASVIPLSSHPSGCLSLSDIVTRVHVDNQNLFGQHASLVSQCASTASLNSTGLDVCITAAPTYFVHCSGYSVACVHASLCC